MFEYYKKEFSEELKVLEAVSNIFREEQASGSDGYYIVSESIQGNQYERIESLPAEIKSQIEMNIAQGNRDAPLDINAEFIINKLNKRSLFKQKIEALTNYFSKVKKNFFAFLDSYAADTLNNYPNAAFKLEINISQEYIGILISNMIVLYSLVTHGKAYIYKIFNH